MKKVGLALGGGGARGIAHIAYLKAIDELGIKPSVISGTSSGAIVGALYAGGMTPDEMYAMAKTLFRVKKNDKENAIRIKDIPSGILSSMIIKYLSNVLPRRNFEDLDIPFKLVTTNFRSLEEKVISNGEILPALMGSIAFPGAFTPQLIGQDHYIDGGATNIVPFDIIREECEVLIAIDVSMIRPNNFKIKKKKAIKATWAATQQALISLKLKHCPVEIFERPNFDNVKTLEFYKYKRVYKRAEEYIPDFIKKLETFL